MSRSVEQLKLYDKIKLSYLRHLGDALKVSEELDLPLDYVRKIVKKIRGEETSDHKVLVANNLTQQILLGYKSRETYYLDMLRDLDSQNAVKVSSCCKKPVRATTSKDDPSILRGKDFVCTKCCEGCDVVEVPFLKVFNVRIDILRELRKNDEALVKIAEVMGYTQNKGNEEPKHIHNTKNNILVMRGKDMSKEEQQALVDLDQLSGMDREVIRKRLESQIFKESEDANEVE